MEDEGEKDNGRENLTRGLVRELFAGLLFVDDRRYIKRRDNFLSCTGTIVESTMQMEKKVVRVRPVPNSECEQKERN